MNERLQGWRLALALLIPAAIISGAGFFAYGALSDNGAHRCARTGATNRYCVGHIGPIA